MTGATCHILSQPASTSGLKMLSNFSRVCYSGTLNPNTVPFFPYGLNLEVEQVSEDVHGVSSPPVLQLPSQVVTSPCAGLTSSKLCSPLLDLNGLCHCTAYSPGHVPVLAQRPGHSYPPCRDPSFRVLYIDDALIASVINIRLCTSATNIWSPWTPWQLWAGSSWRMVPPPTQTEGCGCQC